MTGHLNTTQAPVHDPAARLGAPGLAIVYLTDTGPGGSYLTFGDPADAREVAAACERAAQLLEGPQLVGET